tara:strand:+ start:7621 stop:7971 length:351 start_codon:yes stop_codon:yes gene_type:complete
MAKIEKPTTGKGSGNKRGTYKKKDKKVETTKLVKKETKKEVPTLIPVPRLTKTIAGVRTNCLRIGDSQYRKYVESGDVGHAAAALAGYKLAITATQTQMTYQKITGRTTKVKFCEE